LAEEVVSLIELIEHAEESDRASLEEETEKVLKKWEELETQLYLSGEFDMNNCYLSISGGAGGT